MVKNEDGNADKSYDYLCQGHSHGTDGRRLNVHQLLHRAQSLVHTHIHTARQPCTHTPESSSASTQTHKYKEGVNGKRGSGKSVSKGWTGLGGHKGRNSKLLFREMLEHQLMWEKGRDQRRKENLAVRKRRGRVEEAEKQESTKWLRHKRKG